MLDLLVLGAVGVDTIVRVPDFSFPPGDSLHVPPVRDFVGHTGNGVALASRRLGRGVRFVDFLGDDAQGRLILDRYAEEELDFRFQKAPNGTPRGVNFVDESGRRFSFYDGRHPADLRLDPEFLRPHVLAANQVHVSISNVCRDVFPLIDRETTTVSTDLHSWDGKDSYRHVFALNSDIVTMSAEKLGAAAPEAMEWVASHGRARAVVATDGAAGGWYLDAEGLRRYEALSASDVAGLGPAWEGWEVVDSNGAGDAFTAGFLWAWGKGMETREAVLAGSVAGAWTVRSAGTHTDFIGEEPLAEAVAALS
ncbi:carbohydrate kinase family protein [Salininema proteolyticum]|uniref:Carbohydrate kinase family protein n=1 Tax=Salininema proteolyticum TaxID=1607685 RepID=A0ABV8TVS6_9ACTN